MRKLFFIFLIILLWGTSACANNVPESEPTPTETAVSPTATPVPSATPTRTPRPTATPFAPNIVVEDQEISDDGVLVIKSVFMTEPGWVVLFALPDEKEPSAIGATGVSAGSSENVEVTVNPLQVTETIMVALHDDTGQIGVFEFPDADLPVENKDQNPSGEFEVSINVELPVIIVDDQDVTEDGIVQFETVLAVAPSWIVIHSSENDGIGNVIGSLFVEPGLYNELNIPIRWREGTPELAAILYEDNGRSRTFEIGEEDLPVLVGGNMVLDTFEVTLPPDIVVYDQPVIDGTITVERVISNGPAHVVVYYDDGDVPGLIIGSEFLEDGLNEQVVVNIVETAVTPQLFLFIHEDTTVGDNFDFPANDPPQLYNGRVPDPFTFNTTPGNYLITRDQELVTNDEETAVFVPLAVVDVPAWIGIHSESNGTIGEQVGLIQLMPGINRELSVVVDETAVTDNLYAVLYLDAGEIGEFEEETDIALQRNRGIIQAPFKLLGE